MYQHITEPTRYREGNRPTLDDPVFSSEQNSVTRITHQSCLGKSDHEAITCEILTEPMTASNTKINVFPRNSTLEAISLNPYG